MDKNKQTIISIAIVAIAILIAAIFIYKNNKDNKIKKNQTGSGTSQKATDYSKSEHWLSLPSATDKKVDVFYLYPTAWQKTGENDPNVLESNPDVCNIDNPSMLQNAPLAFQRQATAFEPIANIYAPYYRQVDLNLSPQERTKATGEVPTLDATAAFDYYIKYYNNGRPFILAGHSQGSNVMINLLSGYMKKNPEVYKRMIVAYVIGYSVTNDYLAQNPYLKFAEGSDDTGVIVSYNTEAPNVVPGTNPVVLPGALAINPITWTRGEELATADKNLGSIMLNQDGSVVLDKEGKIEPVKNYADARVDKNKGVIICSTADVEKLAPGNQTFGKGVFHSFDYPFYYFDIRENAARRVENFLNKNREL